jgi:hypothetical protein
MPIYEFENAEAGLTVDVYMAVTQLRDEIVQGGVVLKRRRVPSRISTPRINQTEHQASEVLKGYRALEDAGKLGKSTYSAKKIKEAWAMPDNEG